MELILPYIMSIFMSSFLLTVLWSWYFNTELIKFLFAKVALGTIVGCAMNTCFMVLIVLVTCHNEILPYGFYKMTFGTNMILLGLFLGELAMDYRTKYILKR